MVIQFFKYNKRLAIPLAEPGQSADIRQNNFEYFFTVACLMSKAVIFEPNVFAFIKNLNERTFWIEPVTGNYILILKQILKFKW